MSGLVVREAETDADLEAWARVCRLVLPNDTAWTVAQFRSRAEPTRRVIVAELDGEIVGCGQGGRSDVAGRAFVTPRTAPDARRRGVGGAMLHDLLAFCATLGYPLVVGYADGEAGKAFGERFGFAETDRQVEQVIRLTAPVELSALPAGVEVVTIEQRPELLEAAYPLAVIGYADMALESTATIELEEWLEDEATLPAGSFVALHDGKVIGYSGLCEHDNDGTAEDGLTVIDRDWRGRGLSVALKQRELAWAQANGIAEVITWTQKNNEGMRRANEKLGYLYRDITVTMTARLEDLAV